MLSSRVAARAFRAGAPRAPIASSLGAIRTYATPANSVDSKPPVALFGVDGTYASALYTAAAKNSTLDATGKAIENLHQTFTREDRLKSILSAPTLSGDDKSQIISEIQKSMGTSDKGATETIKHFLDLLAENNRLSVLEGVCEKFATLMGAHRGEVELTITSAAQLDAKISRQIETAVSKSQFVGQGKKLKVVSKVNPDIRGGLIVEVGDRTIDLSVSSKMARMNKLLQDTL